MVYNKICNYYLYHYFRFCRWLWITAQKLLKVEWPQLYFIFFVDPVCFYVLFSIQTMSWSKWIPFRKVFKFLDIGTGNIIIYIRSGKNSSWYFDNVQLGAWPLINKGMSVNNDTRGTPWVRECLGRVPGTRGTDECQDECQEPWHSSYPRAILVKKRNHLLIGYTHLSFNTTTGSL